MNDHHRTSNPDHDGDDDSSYTSSSSSYSNGVVDDPNVLLHDERHPNAMNSEGKTQQPLTETEIRRMKRRRRRMVAVAGGGVVVGTVITGGIGPAVVAGSIAAAAVTRSITKRRERVKDRNVRRAINDSDDVDIDITIPTSIVKANDELLVNRIQNDAVVDGTTPFFVDEVTNEESSKKVSRQIWQK